MPKPPQLASGQHEGALLCACSHCGCFHPQSHAFSYYPHLMTIGEGWNVNWSGKSKLVNLKLHLLARPALHHNGLIKDAHYCWCCTNPSVHFLLHFISKLLSLFTKQHSEMLQLLRRGQHSFPTQRKQSTIFQQRTTSSPRVKSQSTVAWLGWNPHCFSWICDSVIGQRLVCSTLE